MLSPADERQFHLPGIGDIDRDVQKVFAEPEGTEGDAKCLFPKEETHKNSEGDRKLHDRAAPDPHVLTEKSEEQMAEFMEGKIDPIKQ